MKSIVMATSHHACIDPRYKGSTGNFNCALNGVNCAGFSLQAVWTKLYKQDLAVDVLERYLVRMAKWMSSKPAAILKINGQRGSIQKGKLADLVVWEPYKEVDVVGSFSSHTKCVRLLGIR